MHLISTIPGGWNPNDEGVFHIQQAPGDILFLSAADTELYTLNKAYHHLAAKNKNLPSLRLANLTYFKQELTIDTYIEEVASKAQLIILRLLGGKAYFNYLCEALADCAESHQIPIIFLPGDNKPDLSLMELSSLPLEKVDQIWKYLIAAGKQNSIALLEKVMADHFALNFNLQKPTSIPDIFICHPSIGIIKQALPKSHKPLALIIAYRSSYLADNMEPLAMLNSELTRMGLQAVILMALSYRDESITEQIQDQLQQIGLQKPAVIINTTGFSIQSFQHNDQKGLFDHFKVPVLQAIMGSCNQQTWEEGTFGLPPIDVAMNIALPEVDGKIITTVISFKESLEKDPLTDSEVVQYSPHPSGCKSVAQQAWAWTQLQQTEAKDQKIALVLPNYPSKNSRLANGVGLDTPESTLEIIKALANAGYHLGEKRPQSSDDIIELITENITNDLESIQHGKADIFIHESDFYAEYQKLSIALRTKIESQWGHPEASPNYREGKFLIAGTLLGNIFLSIQPNRGYNIDLQATYHSPDLPPTYAYLAYYFWLRNQFKAQAIVHIGKHGNLEWLPGKGVALSKETCFPEAILGAIPHFYPFIINDPGEGTQAKRRNHAVILDHLIPPMTRAENYGDLLKLELLIDEFYESALMDPKRSAILKKKIEQLVNETISERHILC